MDMTNTKCVIFEIKKYATDDGPGIRTTIFLKGCPLRCWWCHNPEGQVPVPELMYRSRKCIQCSQCAMACPKEAITYSRRQVRIDRTHCDLCGRCSQQCPTGALGIVGKEMTIKEVVNEIEKDILFYEESLGGITVSGGEPLIQIDFLKALLEECNEREIHTAVDTCGYATREAFEKIIDKVDVFLFDIKIIADEKHVRYTGVSNELILKNFKWLAENESAILVRFPVIPSINDDENNIVETAELMLSHGIENIYLLPYHRAGIEKYRSLGRGYRLKKLPSPSNENLLSIKKKFEAFGLKVKIGGG